MKKIILMAAVALAMVACSNDDTTQPEPQLTEDDGRTPVVILTRSDDPPQDVQLHAGLFMVNYVNNRQDELAADNNYVNNQLLTWSNQGWATTTPIYWSDMDTPADFYAYAPYQRDVDNARQMTFSVQTDQRTAEAFAQSDFLWGTVQGQTPSAESFDLTLAHQFSQLTVVVTAEAGFDEGELKAEDVAVAIGGSKTTCTIDLATGEVSVPGGSTAGEVQCFSNGDLTYKAVLIPQQIPFANLIQVDWRGNKYTLQNSFTLEAKRQYTLTVRLKKTKSGFDIGIAGWDIIPEDFGGTIGGN